MAAQARMRNSRVLIINLGSVGTEITKNLVLSGIGSLTILDNHNLCKDDIGNQFFSNREQVGVNRAVAAKLRIQDMNPRVKLDVFQDEFTAKPDTFFKQFDLIVATELSASHITIINAITRKYEISLYVTGLHGLFGYIFVDLIEFDAQDEKLKSAVSTMLGPISANREIIEVTERVDEEQNKVKELITTRNKFKPFETLLAEASLEGKLTRRQIKRLSSALPLLLAMFHFDMDFTDLTESSLAEKAIKVCKQLKVSPETLKPEYMKQFVEQASIEFAPVAAVIGGAVAQDCINILGKRQSPLNNFVFFDGVTLDMQVLEL
ncbi:LAMI_0E05028g1_1 [Lachancea mirantina]|uniref:LAMI_0E05028g1_1 n=1 Tax=Lachancea mirantina TaxID=1230905 RepID=A0A1G4JL22_9SACH|nr:LAMI_0E05028g1_1 [Lachancea mirantina]